MNNNIFYFRWTRTDNCFYRIGTCISDAFSEKTVGLFHSNCCEHLQEMILSDITKNSDTVKKFPPGSDSLFFCPGYLHMINMLFIPYRLKNAVGKTKCNHILHGFFSKVMIYPINLSLFKYLCQ